jgi:hypothetical protein
MTRRGIHDEIQPKHIGNPKGRAQGPRPHSKAHPDMSHNKDIGILESWNIGILEALILYFGMAAGAIHPRNTK